MFQPRHLASVPRTGAILLLGGMVALAGGCIDAKADVEVAQPIVFPHDVHHETFASGKHREEKLAMHATFLGDDEEVLAEVARGACTECHDGGPEAIPAPCVDCHRAFQDQALRARKDVRICIACHRQAWSGSMASIPSTKVCGACHAEEARTDSEEEARLRGFLARGEDVPWVQLHRVEDHVYFSHAAHVRFGGMGCTTCHEDMRERSTPPTQVRVYTMDACLACHEDRHVRLDCLVCHQ